MGRSGQPENRHPSGTGDDFRAGATGPDRSVKYEAGLATQDHTLLEVLDKKQNFLMLPLYITELAQEAFTGFSDICVRALEINQVKSWAPLLQARRAVLQIVGTRGSFEQENPIWLPLCHMNGLEAAFPTEGGIDFEMYDGRFSRIQDQEFRLHMAISRLLYPVSLGENACQVYENLIKKRFRPAMLLLVGGSWNWYGRIPLRSRYLLSLKKPDRFLIRELIQTAAEAGQTEFVSLITEMNTGTDPVKLKYDTAATGLWTQAQQELLLRNPRLEQLCGLLDFCPVNAAGDPADWFYTATDGHIVYYDASWSGSGSAAGDRIFLARRFAHMLFHCLYLHPFCSFC